jgi:hypothetical protein
MEVMVKSVFNQVSDIARFYLSHHFIVCTRKDQYSWLQAAIAPYWAPLC